ncbi:hypothetical protein E2562_019778 [Oryza meyeriana var. granulata]|uniref:Uncharacterized protein n=1 Tax=Oryza meyeriana var. granulata TaxID=110450 RepID=A0A6G1DLJ3_9ORYZ|nr:hypothetical protein E2562_019778 [Oryza meyeriana var. granulata]KAF0912974.1 hypothetical protein E2562_019778 [Oryza meyeriana var. granulata]
MFSAPLLADATHGLGAPSGGCVCCYVFYSRQGREVEPVAGHGDSAAALLTAAGKGGAVVGEAPWRQSWRTAVQPRLFSQRRAGGAVVGEAPMEAVPEDGGSAAALLAVPGKAANMCLHVLGLKPATLDPARNKGGATIHTKLCLNHNGTETSESMSSGSDTDDIIALKKYKGPSHEENKRIRVSPDVLVLSGESYDRKCIDACIQAENIYNKKRSTGDNVNFVRNPISSEVGPFYMTPTDALQPLDVNVMHQVNNKGAGGFSTCKMPPHGKRRQIMGSKFTTHPYVSGSNKFFVSRIDKAYYDIVISMSRGQHSRPGWFWPTQVEVFFSLVQKDSTATVSPWDRENMNASKVRFVFWTLKSGTSGRSGGSVKEECFATLKKDGRGADSSGSAPSPIGRSDVRCSTLHDVPTATTLFVFFFTFLFTQTEDRYTTSQRATGPVRAALPGSAATCDCRLR